MAPRKKTKKNTKSNGGPRRGAGRKPVEAHFEALWKRLDTIDNGLTTLLQHTLPELPSKAQELDPRDAAIPLHQCIPAPKDDGADLSEQFEAASA